MFCRNIAYTVSSRHQTDNSSHTPRSMLAWKHMPGYLNAVLSVPANAMTDAEWIAVRLPTVIPCTANLHALTMLRQLTREHDAFYTWSLAKLLT